jgi:protein SCO1/2
MRSRPSSLFNREWQDGRADAVALAATLLCAVLLIGATAGAADDATLKAGVFSPPRQAPDFSLQGSNGNEFKLSHYRGKVVVLAFGFTSCPDVCPTTLGVLAQAHKRLAAQGKDFQVLYITVDPERDDAERMHKYLAGFDTAFIGGTGTPEALKAVRDEYGILASRKPAGNSYVVAHSSFTYLIDRAGSLRALMPYGHTPDDYVHDLSILLKQ